MSSVKPHFRAYGARGVPNGLVDAQTRGYGRTPCRPHSRMILEDPMITEMMFPKAERAMRKLKSAGGALGAENGCEEERGC